MIHRKGRFLYEETSSFDEFVFENNSVEFSFTDENEGTSGEQVDHQIHNQDFDEGSDDEQESIAQIPRLRRSERKRCAPKRYGIDEDAGMAEEPVCHYAYNVCQIVEPTNIQDALTGEFKKEWKLAADSEYKSLQDNARLGS